MKRERHQPPEIVVNFFRWFCRRDLMKYIEGDLMELYLEKINTTTRLRADLFYTVQVLLLLRPGIIRKASFYPKTNYIMYKSYFIIGWRNLLRSKGYSFINIGGLAIGLFVAGLIALWVHDELSFNKYHESYPRIVQIMKGGTFEGKFYEGQRHLPYPLLEELKNSYADNFRYIVPIAGTWENILSTDEKVISATGSYIGSDAPEMFTFKMIYGNRSGLKDKDGIMLSKSTALALFGNVDPVNKLVKISNAHEAKVTGVFEDFPKSSDLNGTTFFASWEKHLENNLWIKQQNWENHFFLIYAEINPQTTLANVTANIREAEIKAIRDIDFMQHELKYNPAVMLHPMSDWHLRSDFREGVRQSGPTQFVIYMSTIGGFVLLLACINFMNLSTARSEKRAREVGIRKTMGSIKSQLISQFFSESFLVVVFASIVGLLLISLALPGFNEFSGKEIQIPFTNWWFWVISFSIIIITGLLAGSYPALYLSSFNPVKVLKGTFHSGRNATTPRKILVVLQFAVSVMLIICTVVVHSQINYAKDRDIGYNRNGLLMIPKKTDDFNKHAELLATELKNSGAVTEISESAGQLTEVWSGNGGFTWQGKPLNDDKGFSTLSVSHDFGKTVGWKFISGRDFNKEMSTDSAAFVITESAAKVFGIPNPVGEVVHWKNTAWNVDKDFEIVGVIKDMVMESPFDPVNPAFFMVYGWKSWMNLRINPALEINDALPKIEAVFKKVIPSVPFAYKFADEQYDLKFKAEERIGSLSSLFSGLAILISCMGLFGLASFMAEQRTKELGIRKVLGASIAQLWKLLSLDFLTLVLVACVIALPLSYYIMKTWLEQYQYRTSLSWEVFVMVMLGAILITVLTVSYQALRAATSNPVKSLRSE